MCSGIPIFLENFPQFVVIHTVKGFSIVSEAEIDVFLEFLCFIYDPLDVGSLISFFKESPQPSDQTHISCIGRRILYH